MYSRNDVRTAEVAGSLAITYGSRTSSHGGETSADFCAYERLRPDGLTLAIGTVSSGGAASRRNAHAVRRAFRMAALGEARPSSILDELGGVARAERLERTPASLFVAELRSDAGMLTYAGTGGGGALVFHNVRRHEHLAFARTTNDNLGSVQRTIAFPRGSVLVAYTCGLARARAKIDGSPLGSAGLARIVHRVLRSSAAPLCSTIWQEIDRFTGGAYRYEATLTLVIALEN